MPLTNAASGGQNKASDIQQIVNLLTGSMTDQPVTFKGDNTRAPTLLTLDSVNAAQPVGLQFADAGSAKWLWQKDASNNFVVTGPAAGRLGVGAAPNANVAVHFLPSFTAPTGTAGLGDFSGTITAHANSDTLIGYSVGTFTGLTFAKSTFTGLLAYGLYVNGSSFAQSGAGTIGTAYALRVTAPTIGTLNVGSRIDGKVGFGADPAANSGAVYQTPVTASSGAAYAHVFDSTVTAAANNDAVRGTWAGHTFATGTFTGLTWYGHYIFTPTKTGTGTVDNAYALFAVAPTLATTNWAGYFSGNVTVTGTLAATLSTAAQPNITSLGTLTSLLANTQASIGVGATALYGNSSLAVVGNATASSQLLRIVNTSASGHQWDIGEMNAVGRLSFRDVTQSGAPTVLDLSGAGPGIGFYGTAATAKQTVTGSRAGNAALASLLTGLANVGLITDSSTA